MKETKKARKHFEEFSNRKKDLSRLNKNELLELINLQESLLQAVGQSVIATDVEGKIIYWNRAAKELYGWSVEEVIGNNIFDYIVAPESAEYGKEIMARLKSGEKWSGEFPVKRKEGSRFWAIVTDTPIKDEKGELVGIIGVSVDITECKNAEIALKNSEEHYKGLFDSMGDGVAVYKAVDKGMDFVFVDINKAGQKLSKVDIAKIKGKKVTEVFPAVREIGLLDVFKKVWKTGKPQHLPLKEYKDGRITEWVENYVYKLPNGQIVAVYNDTSKQKKVEEALRQSEEKFRMMFENQGEGAGRVDLEENFVLANPEAEKLFGVEPGKLVGRNLKGFLSPEMTAFLDDRMKLGIERQKGSYELETIRPDGEIRNLIVTTNPWYDNNGQVIGALG